MAKKPSKPSKETIARIADPGWSDYTVLKASGLRIQAIPGRRRLGILPGGRTVKQRSGEGRQAFVDRCEAAMRNAP